LFIDPPFKAASMPAIEINLLSVILAVVASFIFGLVWYTIIFARIWALEIGFAPWPGRRSPGGCSVLTAPTTYWHC
jgi:hypothetical protein